MYSCTGRVFIREKERSGGNVSNESDNDEKPVALYVSSGQVQINEFSVSVGENWLRAGGGSGVYTVYSSDVDIVKAEISKDVITLKAY